MPRHSQLELAEQLAHTDVNRSYGLTLQLIRQAKQQEDVLLEIRASLLGAYTALRVGEYQSARQLLQATFQVLEPEVSSTSSSEQPPLAVIGEEKPSERLLHALSAALEHHDIETHGHIARVVDLTEKLAFSLNLTTEETRILRIGAYLHDIGKIAIPNSILQKPMGLTPEERRIIEQHTVIGHHISLLIPGLPSEARDIVQFHHERWDGTGYPEQRQAEQIPKLAHIFSIIDVYDALRSARPYKPAWDTQKICVYFRAERDKQFKAALVDAFLLIIQTQ